ncbi:MAG: apolipoprotein acyltransferase [Sulfitobacter sp.]
MIFLGLLVLGAVIGAMTARKRKGNRKDMAQYAAGYGMAFAIVGMILTVVIERLAV